MREILFRGKSVCDDTWVDFCGTIILAGADLVEGELADVPETAVEFLFPELAGKEAIK